MNWSGALRRSLSDLAAEWAESTGAPSYRSLGRSPTILFKRSPDGRTHGNFEQKSWSGILRVDSWASRLEKAHARRSALPEGERATSRELDSSNSSDALLMNCFCHPRVSATMLGVEGGTADPPEFGFSPRVRLVDGGGDSTEVDMRWGEHLVEAKLTEQDFTSRPEAVLARYSGVYDAFDLARLPRGKKGIRGYQLIRNVLAAQQLACHFTVLLDARRPDLLQEWWAVHSCIRDGDLRGRCTVRTWQEVAAAAPQRLRDFLGAKYGL